MHFAGVIACGLCCFNRSSFMSQSLGIDSVTTGDSGG